MGTRRVFSFISFLVVLSLVCGFSEAVADTNSLGENPIRFAILGDRTGGPEEGVYEQIVIEAERLKPEFVVTVGDMIVGYSTDTLELASRWDEFLQMVKPLSVPIYYTAGNNDITYDIAEGTYRRYAGEPNYSFNHRGLHFTIFDNSRWESSGELPEKYLLWLENDLKQCQEAAYTFVFMHKPFWYKTTVQSLPDTLHTLFKAYGVDAVVTGHFHRYFSGDYDGIQYTCLGSSGGGTGDDLIGPKYHFAWVTVDDEGIHLAPIKYEGVMPRDVVTAEEEFLVNKSKHLGLKFVNPAQVGEDMTVARTTVGVSVQNHHGTMSIDDTLRWEVPEGWTVEPLTTPVIVAPGDSGTFEFTVTGTNNLASKPKLWLNMPVREGKSFAISRRLHTARQVSCVRATSPPKLDGLLDEVCWREAETKLVGSDGESGTIDPTRFYFACDSENLYLAAFCEDARMDSLKAEVTEHDGPVYTEDCIGYFIQPNLDEKIVYQIYFNPQGTVYDVQYKAGLDGYFNHDGSWDGAYEIGTARMSGAWTVEVRIPLAPWGVSAADGDNWGLNFRRKQARLSSAADWQQPIDADPQTLGVLRLQ